VQNREEFAQLTDGFEIENLPGEFLLVMPPGRLQPGEHHAPHYEVKVGRNVFLYAPSESKDGSLIRYITLHYEMDEREVARRSLRLLARLLQLHRSRFGRETVFAGVEPEAHVWLAPQMPLGKDAGGMTKANHCYIFGSVPTLDANERLRTLLHEWGHLTLSQASARGFTNPEGDASGYLGERLYLKWLYEEVVVAGKKADDGCDPAYLTLYHQRQIQPLIDQFNAKGPSSVGALTPDGMNKYVGMALATDEAFGSKLLAKGLFGVDGFRPVDLTNALFVGLTQPSSVSINLPAWVPFLQRPYTATAEQGSGGITVEPGKQALKVPAKWTPAPGWKHVKSSGVKRVRIERRK
jgi:hypothetical protein